MYSRHSAHIIVCLWIISNKIVNFCLLLLEIERIWKLSSKKKKIQSRSIFENIRVISDLPWSQLGRSYTGRFYLSLTTISTRMRWSNVYTVLYDHKPFFTLKIIIPSWKSTCPNCFIQVLEVKREIECPEVFVDDPHSGTNMPIHAWYVVRCCCSNFSSFE